MSERDDPAPAVVNPHAGMDRGRVVVGRRLGASPEQAAAIQAANDKMTWQGMCRRCGRAFAGTPAQLTLHRCEGA